MSQEPLVDSTVLILSQGQSATPMLGDFWSLVQQAGPLRWPIFGILGIGLVLVLGKLYELLRDTQVSRELLDADLAAATLPQIARTVEDQPESMAASLHAIMLNVFQTRSGSAPLHEEIQNFVSFRQDQFGVFRRRMDFLSDTAGALGLMGTVWGMFTVFFQGTSDQEVILRGMGIALITTLLGLVVSIILNLSSTELGSFFERRLERVAEKSDELRFRLMELVPSGGDPPAVRVSETSAPIPSPSAGDAGPTTPVLGLESSSASVTTGAGEPLSSAGFRVVDEEGHPHAGVPVCVRGTGTSGPRVLETDAEGWIHLSSPAPEAPGAYRITAALESRPEVAASLELTVLPGTPAGVRVGGNHQAAPAGSRVSRPLTVTVTDRFGNPIPDVPIRFSLKSGAGSFPGGGGRLDTHTGMDGVAGAWFDVSPEPGACQVEARTEELRDPVTFTVFASES